jgi:nickel-dependent lactate racemase
MSGATTVPWRMWHSRARLGLDWPDRWTARVCEMADAPRLEDAGVASRLAEPVAGPPLAELARRGGRCCVLIDDMTRPTPAWRIVPRLLEALHSAGLAEDDVFFIVANGAHRALTRRDLVAKVGEEVCERYHVMRHDTHQNLVEIPVDAAPGGRIGVNRFFREADLRIAVTGVVPHFMTGFSGGAKIVMPAVCGLDTIAATHEHTVEGPPARVGVCEGNRMREVVEECARAAGLHFTANCVFNSDGELCGLHCGTPEPSHRAAVRQARAVYATEVPCGSDIAVFNAFPKDTEFIQAMAALNVWALRDEPARALVRPGGTIVVICAASEGVGAHELIEYGRRHFVRRDRHGSFRAVLADRNLLFLAPGVSPATMHRYYPPRARLFRDWAGLRATLEELHPGQAQMSIFPCSALQLDAAAID